VCETVAKSTLSFHFKVLREAGLVRMVPQGRRVLVSLRREDLETRFPGLLEAILSAYQR
jgi:DNA-binding transcriptional ArsR family regulator